MTVYTVREVGKSTKQGCFIQPAFGEREVFFD
jgi:hypothetical protein